MRAPNRFLILCSVAFQCVLTLAAQSSPPPVSFIRSYVNDLPQQPLITVTITGALDIACFTIEEVLPGGTTAEAIDSDGIWRADTRTVRWGPFFNTVATNVSYRLAGLPGTYPVSGGGWMDGQWHFSPAPTLVTVLPSSEFSLPAPLPQVATPTFHPSGGVVLPTNVTISCATPGAVVYYTLDGSAPTEQSSLYTGSIALTQSGALRARGFAESYWPSVVRSENYTFSLTPGSVAVARYLDTNDPSASGRFTMQIDLAPSGNRCFAFEEMLPLGLVASKATSDGFFDLSKTVVRWGPFFDTNTVVVKYEAAGRPGTYRIQGRWSVDGVSGVEMPTNVVIDFGFTPSLSAPPPQVAMPVFTPGSGSNVPVEVTLSCATAGARIHYTVDGSVPEASSPLYTQPIRLNSASVLRARAFTNGWNPSVVSVGYYGGSSASANLPPARSVDTNQAAAPEVTLRVEPVAPASCFAVTENLSCDLHLTISEGGNFLARENEVRWGPFFGEAGRTVSYRANGFPGSYPVRAAWSVDGHGHEEPNASGLVIASTLATSAETPAPRTPTPVLSPRGASGLPVAVSISCADPQADIYFTTDGSLPGTDSTRYPGALVFNRRTTLRARAFRTGHAPSVVAVGEYVESPDTNALLLVRGVSRGGTVLPSITVAAAPRGSVACYSVTETLAPGLIPHGMDLDAIWDSSSRTIRWGPFLDPQPRALTYNVTGLSQIYPLDGLGSVDGYSATPSGAATVTVQAEHSETQGTNYLGCVKSFSYHLNINPFPGVILVTSASGTLDWGDETQSAITSPVMSFQKQYARPGTYTIRVSADWSGDWDPAYRRPLTPPPPGHMDKTDTIEVLSECDPPLIWSQPMDSVALIGGAAQFSVTATSAFPMFYQWYFNATNPIVAPGTASLRLSNLRAEAAGFYSVTITNAYGSVTSRLAALTLVAPVVTAVGRSTNREVTLNFTGLPHSQVRVEVATNLTPPIFWQPLFTNDNLGSAGAWNFTDTNAIGPRRFYRFTTR